MKFRIILNKPYKLRLNAIKPYFALLIPLLLI